MLLVIVIRNCMYEHQHGSERQQKFMAFRNRVLDQSELELAERIRNNPKPTEQEINLGTFLEALEPQVREAILDLNRKGYQTYHSGFNGFNPSEQYVYLNLGPEIPESVLKKLGEMGVKVHRQFLDLDGGKNVWEVAFELLDPDLDAARTKWQEVSAQFPDTGQPAAPVNDFEAIKFRYLYAPQIPVDYDALNRRLALETGGGNEQYFRDLIAAMRQGKRELPVEPWLQKEDRNTL